MADRTIPDYFPSSSRGDRGNRGPYRGNRRNFHTQDQDSTNTSSTSNMPNTRGNRLYARGRGGRSYQMSASKSARARAARETINTTIPNILAHNTRAKDGVEGSLKYLPAQIPMVQKSVSSYVPKVSVVNSDTFDAAHSILERIKETRLADYNAGRIKIAVLNMASNTSPGGGVLNGSQAQEETLCRRSTLYPSLDKGLHPLQPGSAVYTSDVLVFMNQRYEMLPEAERWFVDVISMAAPKRPDLSDDKLSYADQATLEELVLSIKNMMRLIKMKGVTHFVAGAFGCGAYGNPNKLVADVFRRVLTGRRFGISNEGWEKEEREVWDGVEEVVFAVYGDDRGKGNLGVFEEGMRGVISWHERQEGEPTQEGSSREREKTG